MLFNSLPFLLFFPFVTVLYFVLPHRYRWAMLLAASCYFYMFFKISYILILFFTIVIDYYAGILLEQEKNERRKRWWLIMSLIANIGVLAVFKYYNFLNANISGICTLLGYHNPIPFLKILLPIGLSFHTFQAMSYTIEVYRGNQAAERHFGIYALYVMFFPQLVAGPIERPQHLLHQFYEKHVFDYNRAVEGIRLILWGIFKKVVIADRLAPFVDQVYNHPHNYYGFQVILATFFFTIEIYCDFSGYTDIARGTARVLGFELMKNFNRPYNAKNITEFWRRWHISLSTWFNDYLFSPIVIARRDWGKFAVAFGLIVTFFISGLWHGAAWTFIIWGLLHGLACTYDLFSKKARTRLSKMIPPVIYNSVSWFLTFCFLMLAYVFFRAPHISDALVIIGHSFQLAPSQISATMLGPDVHHFALCFVFIALFQIAHWIWKEGDINFAMNTQPKVLRWGFYLALVLLIVNFGAFGDHPFIYFQF